MLLKKHIVLIVGLLVWSTTSSAFLEIRSEKLTTVNGLADNSIRSIYQDSKGFLWMATLNGLSRYDGNSIVNFRPQANRPYSFTDHRIKSVVEDHNGFLWITTFSETFSCYDLRRDCFVDYMGKENVPHRSFRQLSLIGKDVWLYGKKGCMRVSFQDGQFHARFFNLGGKSSSNEVLFICERQGGDVYIGTRKGLFLLSGEKVSCLVPNVSVSRYLVHKDKVMFLTDTGDIYVETQRKGLRKGGKLPLSGVEKITGVLNIGKQCVVFTMGRTFLFDLGTHHIDLAKGSLHIPNGVVDTDNRGNYWVSNKTGNLYYIHSQHGFQKVFPLMFLDNVGFLEREQYHVIQDLRGIIWITTHGNGLFAYNSSIDSLQHFVAGKDNNSVIGSNFLQNIMQDRTGGIWVSSEYSGVSNITVINEGADRLYPELLKRGQFVNTDIIRMLCSTQDGDIWVGTRNGGIYQYDSSLSSLLHEYHYPVNTYTIYRDRKGHIWRGTRGDGFYVDEKQYLFDGQNSSSVSRNAVYAFCEDRKGRVWVGTFGRGLALAIPGKNGYTFKRFFQEQTDQKCWVRSLVEDNYGRIWMGTSGGLVVFSPDELLKDARHYKSFIKDGGQLNSDEIRSLMKDRSGRIWFSEAGEGFGVCNPNKDVNKLSFQHYNVCNGLVNCKVQAFAEDQMGNVWISTEYGISCFSFAKGAFENYFFSNSMLGDVYCENSAVTLPDGRLAFGSNSGVVIINPHSLKRQSYTADITFTDLKINGVSVSPNDEDSPLQAVLAYDSSIQLKYDQHSFVIQFSTFDYSSGGKSKYIYKLENYDDNWSEPSPLNFAAYKNLSPGTYYLHVKACNASGVWSTKEAVLKITVSPPFWLTGWAFMLYIILLCGASYVALRIIHKMDALRNKVKMEKQLTEYKLVFFTNISHEFRTPLTLIQGALDRMQAVGKLPEKFVFPVRVMDRSVQRMLRLVNQLIEFRKMQHGKLVLALEETDVIPFLDDIFCIFKEATEDKHIDYRFSSSMLSCLAYIDREKVDKIVYNLLSNAVKYTTVGGSIELSVEVDEETKQLSLKVSDTGVGIPEEKRKELFSRFMQTNYSGNSMGIGLHLVSELVKVHRGSVVYTENKGGGSVFTVFLPMDVSVYDKTEFLNPEGQLLKNTHQEQLSSDVELAPDGDIIETSPVRPLNDQHLLLIEDDKDVREFLQSSLGEYFRLTVAEDGEKGLEAIRQCHPDLIISDVLMPGCSGFEVVRKVKNNFDTSHIPIILLTALSAPESQLEGVESGADAYITKPFSLKFLLASVSKLLQQREKLREKFVQDPHSVHATISVTEKDKQFADRLIAVFESQLSNSRVSVEDLAAAMNMGRTLFYTKVRGVTGYSPAEYLRILRMKKGALMLSEDPSITVAEVADKVGINDPFYFSRCFKKQFGVSPSVYQKGVR